MYLCPVRCHVGAGDCQRTPHHQTLVVEVPQSLDAGKAQVVQSHSFGIACMPTPCNGYYCGSSARPHLLSPMYPLPSRASRPCKPTKQPMLYKPRPLQLSHSPALTLSLRNFFAPRRELQVRELCPPVLTMDAYDASTFLICYMCFRTLEH